jgi:hypothetical protein
VDYVAETLNTVMGVTAQGRRRPKASRSKQTVQLVGA